MLPIYVNYVVSLLWAYCMVIGVSAWAVTAFVPGVDLGFGLLPELWGTVLTLTYLIQALVSTWIDERFERGTWRSVFWMIWYPLAFWMIRRSPPWSGLPRALMRPQARARHLGESRPGAAMNARDPRPWPPLVGVERVPTVIRVRDTALTLLAWATLVYLLQRLHRARVGLPACADVRTDQPAAARLARPSRASSSRTAASPRGWSRG